MVGLGKKSKLPKRQNPYQFFSVASDVLAIRKTGRQLEVLLIERRYPPFKDCWAVPGGFLEIDEDALTAAQREFSEEAGLWLAKKNFVEFGSFSAPDRDPRGRTVTIAYWVFVKNSRLTAQAGDDAKNAQWFPIKRLPPLAFDHAEMIRKGLADFHNKLRRRRY